jgi:hypothetical protein
MIELQYYVSVKLCFYFRFQEKAHFPGIIGCIDCTHVHIFLPQLETKSFKNYRGNFTVNVQLVMNH